MSKNKNIELLAEELSRIIDRPLTPDHIHPVSKGRFYYTQAPLRGAPMLMNHYRGSFFVDIHPDDFTEIESGAVSAHEYIYSANWLIGYYWAGGSMICGSYYQPFDIIGRNEEVKRYFRILSCRRARFASGYVPSEERCNACPIVNCPFSKYQEGNWENELKEDDPRMDFFNALRRRFEKEFPGYTFKGFYSHGKEDNVIILSPDWHYVKEAPFSFVVYASEDLIQALLMRTVNPKNWDQYVQGFSFQLHKTFIKNDKYVEATLENIHSIFEGMDYAK